jgi:hypothetical protein
MALPGSALEIVEEFETVEGRDSWFTPWGGPPDVRSLTRVGETVFVNVHVGGIVRGDGDKQWEPTLDISTDVHEVKAAGDTLLAACAIGFAQSDDLGNTWTFDDEGLHATYARAVAANSSFVFMSVAHGPRGGDATIYRKLRDGSQNFERCDLPSFRHNIDTGRLDANDAVIAFGTGDGDVYASGDGGLAWERVATDLPPITYLFIE